MDERLPPLLRAGDLRNTTLGAYAQARDGGWPFLSDVLERAFKDAHLRHDERGIVAETVQDLVRWHRKVDHALGPDATGLARLGATLVFTGALDFVEAESALGVGLGALQGLDERIAGDGNATRRLALQHSLPDWLAQRLLNELGPDRAASLAAALNRRPPQTLRVNTLKAPRDDVAAELLAAGMETAPTARASAGLTLRQRGNVFGLSAFHEGRVEMQDEASQLVCEVVAPPPGGFVVDACAGAGGKTLGVAAQLGNKGRIVALDPSGTRIAELKRRAARAGAFNIQAHKHRVGDALPDLLKDLTGRADRVLVDAPCSGLGALRRNPEARWRVTPDDVERLRAQQVQIARDAAAWVKPGGRLVYATCTFLRAECEDVVDELRAAVPELEPVRIKEILGGTRSRDITDDDGMMMRTWPDLHEMDGFFTAVFRRRR